MDLKCTLLFVFVAALAYGQNEVSTNQKSKPGSFGLSGFGNTSVPSNYTGKQKQLLIKDNLTFATYSLQLSFVEKEIFDAEALECTANLKRDTVTLRNLWGRDFTADEPLNELVMGKNPLPYYVSFSRMVENFMQKDDMVYTSGYETVQWLKSDSKLEEPIKRNFYHTWIKKNGKWMLVAKSHDQTD